MADAENPTRTRLLLSRSGPSELEMHIAIARFGTVPAERDKDFRDWFTRSNDQLRAVAGLRSRRLLRAPDGSYTALVEYDSAGAFAAMRQAEAVSMIDRGLGGYSTTVCKR